MRRIFLLSPARADGERAQMLMTGGGVLGGRLRRGEAIPIGEIFTFLSGLYFRGKLAYASAFASATSISPVRIITTDRGLLTPQHRVLPNDLTQFARVDLGKAGTSFETPLVRDAEAIARDNPRATVVLLGSIATNKYVAPLLRVFGDRLVFPIDFVGRGDMSWAGTWQGAPNQPPHLRSAALPVILASTRTCRRVR